MSFMTSKSTKIALGMTAILMTPLMLVNTSHAAAASPAVAAKNLNELLSGVNSMTANFSQTIQTNKGKDSKFSGTMAVQRPNLFRWHTTSPADQLIVADAKTMWIYDKDLFQAVKQSTGSQIGDTPAILLSGSAEEIAKNFKISQPDAAKNYYVLKPKSAQSKFNKLSISFNGGKPVMMVLNDSVVGKVTSIRFSNVKLNQKLPNSQFTFTPPSNVEVIEQ
ncbi:outer membrane lipoprotein chaperone LolA [Moraxella nasovis]|uniref:outer membrane lipoprotein chaperone LolA n=1 Tax=Moraxella nasovis TaxID=2904121 RepID=UPI001F61ADCB|nr:outer membrane lipoprotein chaperone LolA [Moraxella nasovis]UNU73041.1 outer membrane lipoprotein chaperone LolA [Moraxella nasovis]